MRLFTVHYRCYSLYTHIDWCSYVRYADDWAGLLICACFLPCGDLLQPTLAASMVASSHCSDRDSSIFPDATAGTPTTAHWHSHCPQIMPQPQQQTPPRVSSLSCIARQTKASAVILQYNHTIITTNTTNRQTEITREQEIKQDANA